jgi:branched-chain amino acid transport system permease protein
MIYFAKRISMTKVGRAWVAIRDNELAAQAMGINVFYYKLLAFFVGCFFAGIAGSLWVHYSMSAILDSYTFLESIWFIGIIIVGGLGSITGTIFGAVFVRLLWEYAYRFANILTQAMPNLFSTLAGSLPTLLLGIVFILILVFEPRGLYHRWELFKMSYRVWPYSY